VGLRRKCVCMCGHAQKMNVVAYPFYGYWEDIGTVKSFFEENLKLTRHVSH